MMTMGTYSRHDSASEMIIDDDTSANEDSRRLTCSLGRSPCLRKGVGVQLVSTTDGLASSWSVTAL
jgi:hypothetical protein